MAGTELIRRNGYSATSIDSIVEQAGVSKGSFFYHFEGKEELTRACLDNWNAMAGGMLAMADFQQLEDPLERLQGFMEFFIEMFSREDLYKSCLAGTTVQEVSDSRPELREAAQRCFSSAVAGMTGFLEAAAGSRGLDLPCEELARLWMATLQGSLLLAKASGDDSLIPTNLRCQRDYIMGLLE